MNKVITAVLFFLFTNIVLAQDPCRRGGEKDLFRNVAEEVVNCRNGGSLSTVYARNFLLERRVADQVQQACQQQNCHGNNVDSPTCRLAFAQALRTASSGGEMRSALLRSQCDFDRGRIDQIISDQGRQGGQQASSDPLSQCYFVTKTIINPGTTACGRTPACLGVIYCPSGVLRNGELADVACEAQNNQCPSPSQCANADFPSWVSPQGRPQVNRGINFRSGVIEQ
jgi:hypothetical protein